MTKQRITTSSSVKPLPKATKNIVKLTKAT